MSGKLNLRCIDINSPYCPCLLAETNHCVFCSHLKGENLCNCNWMGVCILYEKQWQYKNKEWLSFETDNGVRTEIETELSIEQLCENTYLLAFDVTSDLATAVDKPGAFVFLKKIGDPTFCHFPVGIMKVTGTTIQVVVETIGPKSARLFHDNNRKLLVRGPYFNGIFGQPWIDNINNGKILLVSGGMGQPPAIPIVRKLTSSANQVEAILAPGKIGCVFIDNELRDLGVKVTVVPSLRHTGMQIVAERLSNRGVLPDLIVSCGPDDQHYGVIAAMQTAGVNIPMAATNNATMCCGEGLCGSCERGTKGGQKVRTCKVQADYTEFIQD
ncbi:MAG TPA: hypothetical protein PKA28_01985 [Methylomusa anaerophila]|uniref:Dihydroorotate dehydrogenase B (NAD(+)), electron transfer subunit n=1 Tax=Methylomusa anaerophila TaxID=1930071 RepID=A0A348APG6_9FIRM|nr:hypothetical protein [Methylomusa anaerophila]BBB92964.1 hypothetical protein MAMMFC1_03672 [Methylomusa anaerophila]HML87202.1 hypothetical protein [Methylomusa anaerophila]